MTSIDSNASTQAIDFINLLRSGARPVIEFTQAIEDYEDYAERGMRARVVQLLSVDEAGDTAKLSLDYGEFDAFNRPMESANFLDSARNPTLTAREAGWYKPLDTLFISISSAPPFKIVKDDHTAPYDTAMTSIDSNLSMQAGDFIDLLRAGAHPVIQFTQAIEDYEEYAERGMRARVVQLLFVDKNEDVAKLSLDYGEFDAFNRPMESSNYFDKAGKPTLTAREAGSYKPVDTLLISISLAPPFEIVKDEHTALYDAYLNSKAPVPYLNWLESRVLELQAAVG